VSNNVRFSLASAVDLAAKAQPVKVDAKAAAAVVEFVTRRLEQLLVDSGVPAEAGEEEGRTLRGLGSGRGKASPLPFPLQGSTPRQPPTPCLLLSAGSLLLPRPSHSPDPALPSHLPVRAVLAERGDDPALAAATAEELQAALAAGESGPLRAAMTALSRPTRIVRGKEIDPSWRVDASKFEGPEEAALHEALREAQGKLAGGGKSVPEWLDAVGGLVSPIDAFFEKVFVMCDDEGVRRNRLALLRDVAAVADGYFDLSQLPGF
jgi:glycyl-tRNA synthetase beta subunit